jgi:signal transduction histidine kinase
VDAIQQHDFVGPSLIFGETSAERQAERTRIARDFHDTLLQSLHGVLLSLNAVTILLPDRPTEARQSVESAIELTRQAIAEGRDALQGLRSSKQAPADLACAINATAGRLLAGRADRDVPDFCIHVEGAARAIDPMVHDEAYRIALEALRNAVQHAHAARIKVDIRYDPQELRLRIRDDGKGIDPDRADAERAGHYGLVGMHERARFLAARLAIRSAPGSGTDVELAIPATVAYRELRDDARSMRA